MQEKTIIGENSSHLIPEGSDYYSNTYLWKYFKDNGISNLIHNFEALVERKSFIPSEHLLYGETFLWEFLHENSFKFDIIIDENVEDLNYIKDRKILFLNCHKQSTLKSFL